MRLFPIALLLLLTWGALAVGGSPSWAAAPVVVFGVATGILGFLERGPRTSRQQVPHRGVILALCLFLAAVGLQLLPLPESVITRLRPADGVADYERLLATADRRDPEMLPISPPGAPRPLSIAPSRTRWGLSFIAGFALFLVGAAHGLSAASLTTVTRAVTTLGVVVALMGIYQVTRDTKELYGFYVPLVPSRLSAPFVNQNHQAGWLVMVVSLSLGSFVAEVERGLRMVTPRWRDRILWFSSKQANLTILLLFASAVMAVGILVTQSRSGAATLALAIIVLAFCSSRGQSSRLRRRVVTVGLIAITLIAVSISGSAVARRIAGTFWFTLDGRGGLWEDSFRILGDYWLTGTGFNTYGVAMLHYQTLSDGYRYIEAHNDYLQIAIEGGLLVGIPALILIACLIAEIRRRFRERADDTRTYWLRVGAVTGLVSIAAQSMLEFTLQMPGAAVMFATLLARAIHQPRPRAASPERHGD